MSENYSQKQWNQATPMPAKFLLPDGTVVDELPTAPGLDGNLYYSKSRIDEILKTVYRAGGGNINTLALCQSVFQKDFNKFPKNIFYAFSLTEDIKKQLLNAPPVDTSNFGGGFFFFGKSNQAVSGVGAGEFQLFADEYGERLWIRFYWASAWMPWFDISGNEGIIRSNDNKKLVYNAIKSKSANLKSETTMLIDSNIPFTDLPLSGYYSGNGRKDISGVLHTYRYSENYNIQEFMNFSPNGVLNEWKRIVSRATGLAYTDWQKTNGDSVRGVLALGDSICWGNRNSNYGFVGDLGVGFKNIGVSGATISNANSAVKNIPQQLVDFNVSSYSPDVVIAEGGINDYYRNASMGTISESPVYDDTGASSLDRSTLIGGLEYLFYLMIKKLPTAQRFFVITHKTYRQEYGYAPTTQNEAGWTQQDMHDKIIEVCKLYNVYPIDVYEKSFINSRFSQYVSPVPYSQDSSVNNKYCIDNDGVHPLALGYKVGYIPLIREALHLGTGVI